MAVSGLVRWLLTRNVPAEVAEERRERGVLFGSGLVGGGGLTGVLLAVWVGVRGGQRIVGFPPDISDHAAEALAFLTILAILGCLAFVATLGASEINIFATGLVMIVALLYFPNGIVGTLAAKKKLPRFLDWD